MGELFMRERTASQLPVKELAYVAICLARALLPLRGGQPRLMLRRSLQALLRTFTFSVEGAAVWTSRMDSLTALSRSRAVDLWLALFTLGWHRPRNTMMRTSLGSLL
jgi:hypothetical protein